MLRVTWPFRYGCPSVCVELTLPDGQPLSLDLLVNTSGRPGRSGFDLVLEEADCQLCGG